MAAGSYNYYQDQRAPPAPPPPEPQATYQEPPAPAPAYAPPPSSGSGIIKTKGAGMMVLLGVIIFFVGAILVQSIMLMEPPDSDDYDDYEDYQDDRDAYQDSIRNLNGSGRILNWVGAMIIALPLYVAGTSNEKLDWKVRASMLSAGTALVIATMIVSLFTTTAIF